MFNFHWKLRYPLFLFIIGLLSGICQLFPNLFFYYHSSMIASVIFIGLLIIIYLLFERTKVNEVKVHFMFGLGLIFIGILIDSMTS